MNKDFSWATPTSTTRLLRRTSRLLVFIGPLLGSVVTTTAWAADEIDIDRAVWSTRTDQLTVRGDNAPGNATVTIRYGNKEDNGARIGTTLADTDGNWNLKISALDPVPCDVTAEVTDSNDDKRVRRTPKSCSNDGGVVEPPPVNTAPVLAPIGDKTVTAGNSLAFTVTASDDELPNDTLTLSASNNLPTGASFTNNGNGTGNFIWPNAEPVGSTDVIFSVSDGELDDSETVSIAVNDTPAAPNVSINSTSQNSADVDVKVDPNDLGPVPVQPFVGNSSHRVMAINDLGMHCGDYDTRIASILPPFQVLLAQVVQKGSTPRLLDKTQAEVIYSAVSNPDDPILNNPNVFTGVAPDGSVYKTNFWNTVASGAYDPFYPPQVTPLAGAVTADMGLPVPNVEVLYIGPDGIPGTEDDATGKDTNLPLVERGTVVATQHAMPGLTAPYLGNAPHVAEEFYKDKPFFANFPFGYVAENLRWFEGSGIPFSAFDDFGREAPYPLVRVQANVGGTTVATTDTVLPISGEASCKNCHSADVGVSPSTPHAGEALVKLTEPASEIDDPASGKLPVNVSIEYATDLNILKLHDQEHGTALITGTTVDFPKPGTLPFKPVVCQVCHYTPALDLAHVGPLGADHPDANGRTQLSQSTMSNVMHSHHGDTGMFPVIPAPIQNDAGIVTNQDERLAAMEASCYQCHPGNETQCLRGAMFNGDMVCSDCHGNMAQVGNDFSKDVSPANVGGFILTGNFYDPDDPQPRVPWANEPGCGSCHTGDATSNQAGDAGTIVNTRDMEGNVDGIRLRQAFITGEAKATPIVPDNNRFAENIVPASFNGVPNPGAGNPQLYRVSKGHGGVMCEGCHGATHAEWPNANPFSNDNTTAKQLQGHTGTIAECNTCHNSSAFEDSGDLELTMGGPHGMHAVGSRHWNTHHKEAQKGGGDNCRTCHGSDGEGTVLSRMATDRTLECKDEKGDFCADEGPKLFPKGHVVGCNDCHSNVL